MAGWKAKLYTLNLDQRKLVNDINRGLREATKEGARVWLDAVLAVIPTWSRASRATFESLAQAVDYKITYGPMTAFYDRTQLGLSTGFGGLEKSKGGYIFYYRTSLRYLIFNEANVATVGVAGVFKGLINPTPYNFFELGEQAFREYAARISLPPIAVTFKRL